MTVPARKTQRKKADPLPSPAVQNALAPAGERVGGRPDAAAVLDWYGRHRRTLPWRAPLGATPDPYRVWLSEIMLAQTTVRAVGRYFARFIARWPNVRALAEAPLEEVLRLWAGLGYYARARNLHACAKVVVERHGGCFPASEAALASLPGIGTYTAAAIAAIAFDLPAAAVDGNVERVVARLFAVEQELPAAKAHIRRLAQSMVPDERAGDFAQALMDLGAGICTPKRPACALCPLMDRCAARRSAAPERYPVKARRKERPLRRGAAFVVTRSDGCVLVRSRAPTGLLGGMTEVPTTHWSCEFDERRSFGDAPRLAHAVPRWRRIPGCVTHVFTHFPLELVVYAATVPSGVPAPAGMRWVALAALAGEALPNVMRKVVAHAFCGRGGAANMRARGTMGARDRRVT
jgi:A/G-specific adenine glycosylase